MMLLFTLFVVLVFPALVTGMCPYIDAHWRVNYNRGLQKFHEDNVPEPPLVTQVGPARYLRRGRTLDFFVKMNCFRIRVKWGHLVKDPQCVDRWDKRTLPIFNLIPLFNVKSLGN